MADSVEGTDRTAALNTRLNCFEDISRPVLIGVGGGTASGKVFMI